MRWGMGVTAKRGRPPFFLAIPRRFSPSCSLFVRSVRDLARAKVAAMVAGARKFHRGWCCDEGGQEEKKAEEGRYNGRSSGRLKCAATPEDQAAGEWFALKLKLQTKTFARWDMVRAKPARGSMRLEVGRVI